MIFKGEIVYFFMRREQHTIKFEGMPALFF